MTDREKAQKDQQLAECADMLPGVWWRLFTNMRGEGFSEDQAIKLLCAFIQSLGQR